MENLKQYINDGHIQIAKLDDKNYAHKIPFSQFQSEVNRQQKNTKVYQSLQSLTWDDKYQWVNLKRLKAKQQYNNKQYAHAIEIYMEGLIGIDLKDTTQGRLQIMRDQLQLPITLNIATCLYMKKQYQKAITLCDKILTENPQYLPAVYKKSYLLKHIGNFIQAKQLINSGIKVAKDTKQEALLKNFIQLNGEVMKAAKNSQYQNRNLYARMFGNQTSNHDTSESQSQSSKLVYKTGDPNNKQQEQQILYYQEQPTNICAKLNRKIRNAFFNCFLKLKKMKKTKDKLIHHSKSF